MVNYEIVDFETKKTIKEFSWEISMWADRSLLLDGVIYELRNFIYDPDNNKIIVWVDRQKRYDS